MAYKDSGELPIGQSYQLGAYTFSIVVTPDPGESTTGINVRCDKGDERARVASEVTGTVESWSVEANETEASVYAQISGITGNLPQPVPTIADSATNINRKENYTSRENFTGAVSFIAVQSESSSIHYWISKDPFVLIVVKEQGSYTQRETYTPTMRTINDKPVYVFSNNAGSISDWELQTPAVYGTAADNDLYIILYGEPEPEDILVARFAINLHDAGGTGTDSDWHDPGDWDDERDPEDPPTTLRLTITGASAGAHSGVPSSPAPQQTYGSGGNGGNGGGGGAGASTIIVYKFATDRADNKEITATARGPGAGSGGGPGGRGGDGCILIFY